MSTKSRLMATLLTLLPISFLLSNCGPIVMSAGLSGTVVDAESGVSIEGAIVVAQWNLAGLESALDNFEIQETVSGPSGKYTIAGWGPRINSRFLYAGIGSPSLIVFKDGYHPVFLQAQETTGPWFYRNSESLNELTVSVAPFTGSINDYLELCSEIESRIRPQLYRPGCGWTRIPKLLSQLHSVGLAALETDPGGRGRSLLIDRIPQKNCSDPREFIKNYLE